MSKNLAKETWQIRKPAVRGQGGMVSTQHYLASQVGVDVLRQGGNAVDAAVAAGLAIGVVEPWSSGIGGGGYMTLHLAKSQSTQVIEFGMRAPFESSREDYPLDPNAGRNSAGAFNWPAVKGNVNVSGPLSIAVPGYIRGTALALEKFGTMSWSDAMSPACEIADQGVPIDWYATLYITNLARSLARFDGSKRLYLADGYPPLGAGEGRLRWLKHEPLARTYRTLQSEGPEAYYTGSLAEPIVKDLQALGSRISMRDLSEYQPFLREPLSYDYRDARVETPGNMTAGPSLKQALSILAGHNFQQHKPNARDVMAYVEALRQTYDFRLENLGEGKTSGADNHTSHLSVVDGDGNLVSLTQTVMSPFGSHVILPETGLLMNNGMMWFDPMPDKPNSLEGGRHPLCNMCPTLVHRQDGTQIAVGACGGRKIFPSVMQLVSSILDFNMTVDEAVHQPRIDVSGNEDVWVMDHFNSTILEQLEANYDTAKIRPNKLGGNQFAVPQIVARYPNGDLEGGCYIPSPHAAVMAVSS